MSERRETTVTAVPGVWPPRWSTYDPDDDVTIHQWRGEFVVALGDTTPDSEGTRRFSTLDAAIEFVSGDRT